MKHLIWMAVLVWLCVLSGVSHGQCIRVGYEDKTGKIEEEVWVVDDRLFGCPEPIWILIADGRVVGVTSESLDNQDIMMDTEGDDDQ